MFEYNTFKLKIEKEMPMKNTKIFNMNDRDDFLDEAAEILRTGGTVAFPTETVYGLGANALDEKAIQQIYVAKGRPSDNPLIVHISDVTDLENLVELTAIAEPLMQAFWPGALTLIFKSKGTVAKSVTAGLNTLAIRMPSHKVARLLISKAGVPIAAPSANLSGKPSPTEGNHVVDDLRGRVDGIVIENQSQHGLESTILDLTLSPPMLLRPGSITIEQIEKIIGAIQVDPALEKKLSDHIQPKAPGMKYTHYSPEADVKIVLGSIEAVVDKINTLTKAYPDQKVGVLCCDETQAMYSQEVVISLGSRSQLEMIASNLFKSLRQFDDLKVDIVFCEGYDTLGMGKAIMNRLNKAAGYEIINV